MLWPSFWTFSPGPFRAPALALGAGGPVPDPHQYQELGQGHHADHDGDRGQALQLLSWVRASLRSTPSSIITNRKRITMAPA